MIISTSVGLFGPYERCEALTDRVRVWPSGSQNGADLPISVIGAYEIVDPDLPAGFDVSLYDWVAGQLVRKST